MSDDIVPGQLQRFAIPGRVAITNENGGLTKVDVTTDASTAEIYLHGAHVTRFQKKGEAPLLFMSRSSHFSADKPIRGGVPVIFPWFGPLSGAPAHGFARITSWDLMKTEVTGDGAVRLVFSLPEAVLRHHEMQARVEYIVTVRDRLTMELIVINQSANDIVFENCLHTYFTVGDIGSVSIAGLKGRSYIDKVYNSEIKPEPWDAIWITSEVDRVYTNTTETVDIRDTKLNRTIRVEKSGSDSTVVWNPWINKSKAMPDFGDDEFRQMVCVESGNVGPNKIALLAGNSWNLKVILSSHPS